MKQELKFKTNIKCMGCVSQVTAALNEAVGADNWEVNIQTPDKQLTIKGDDLDADLVIAAVNEAGFKAETITL
jgi:copper chaperone CopZ